MERSAFFNSVNNDRVYNAQSFAEYFASFIANGVFPNPSNNLQVFAYDGFQLRVSPGKAWINGYFYVNDDDLYITLDLPDAVLSRIDAVVLRYSLADRNIKVAVKKGAFSSSPTPPTLQRDASIYELCLAQVYVAAGATSITQADITDTRLSTELCGIVHAVVDQVDTTTLFNQYLSWYQQTTTDAEADIEVMKQQFEQDFNTWFATIQSILDENTAMQLQSQIDSLSSSLSSHASARQVHGVGEGYYIAKTSRSDQLPTWSDIQSKPSSFTPSKHASTHKTGGTDVITPADIGAAVNVVYTATIQAANWSGSEAPFSQSVSVSGILSTDTPIIDVVMSGTYGTDIERSSQWNYVYRAVTGANSITFYAKTKPTIDLPIQIKVVR